MSHWKKGKLNLKCSLSILKRALIKIQPEWEKYIKADPSGGLTVYNSYTGEKTKGAKLIVPHRNSPGGNKNISYADIGFTQLGDGTWDVLIDPASYFGADKLEKEIKQEMARDRLKRQAMMNGWQYKEERAGDQWIIDIIRPVGEEFKLRA